MTPARVEVGRNTKDAVAKSKLLSVPGFLASTVAAEVKKGTNRPDLGLIFSEVPAVVAGVFTRNLVKAAPVQLDLKRIVNQTGRAILVNSGNANACTGPVGFKNANQLSRQISRSLSIPDSQVFLASTGVIGKRLPMTRMTKVVPSLIQSLSPHGLPKVAQAILTTDTFPKIISEKMTIGKKKVHLVGMAKGAGMMHPNMATMLCFVLTDLAVSPALLDSFLRKAVDQSFHRITVDGDTSTNDTVLLMANGLAGNPLLDNPQTAAARLFAKTLDQILLKLARMVVQDGEGATKEVIIRMEGAHTEEEARTLAMTVALSPLVKTALFGEDANWGRILAALGRAGVSFDPERVDIYFDRVQIVKNGISKGPKEEIQASLVLKKPSLTIRIDLYQGSAKTQVYTTDLSLDYIRINAEYRT